MDEWLMPGGASRRFSIERADGEAVVVVALRGELDLETAPEFNTCYDEISAAGLSPVVLDLAGVVFMDSMGLASIMRAQRLATSHGHSLVLRRGSRQVQRLFELTGVLSYLTFEDEAR